MNITAQQVKELREATGVGMMECKKALQENQGDMQKAILWLRERGMSRAASKAGRTAAEGIIALGDQKDPSEGAMIELNCETDFSGKSEGFVTVAQTIANLALTSKSNTTEKLLEQKIDGHTVAETLSQLIAKVGENMQLRKVRYLKAQNGMVVSYCHMGGKIGAMVALEGASNPQVLALGQDIAMHIAAAAPRYLTKEEVNQDELVQEREIARKKLIEQGKPEAMVEKILPGQLNKFYSEVCLLDQPFVKDPKFTIASWITQTKLGVKLTAFARFQLGEGIEVKTTNFADEVAAQLK